MTTRGHLIARASWQVDAMFDLTLMDVELGPFGEEGKPHRGENGSDFTAFNHFIDIKKGAGLFDDYDGYSYKEGSASVDEYQWADELTEGFLEETFAFIAGFRVDEGLTGWWYNNEYVAHDRKASPCLAAYSFPREKGLYAQRRDELAKRFPTAHCIGGDGLGVPYSVFMPVDNLARYWYERFLRSHDPRALGPVMHAIQGASVPHHAAGYCGNYHQDYEDFLNGLSLTTDPVPAARVLLAQWRRTDDDPPTHLLPGDEITRVPALNWRVDYLVTWVALHAFRCYADTFRHFREFGGNIVRPVTKLFSEHQDEVTQLLVLATAMSALVIEKAQVDGPIPFLGNPVSGLVHCPDCGGPATGLIRFDTLEAATAAGYRRCARCLKPAPDEQEAGDYIGNRRSRELHETSCRHTRHIRRRNRKPFGTIETALDQGYNGCHWCLTPYDLDAYDNAYVPRW